MNFQTIINVFHTLLSQKGAAEVPAYPDFTIPPWLHPDLVFRGFTKEPQQLFLFQPTLEDSPEKDVAARTRPTLVWLRKPFHPDWLLEIPETIHQFFQRFQPGNDSGKEVAAGSSPVFFQPRGSRLTDGFFQPRGCTWTLSWDSMPIGRVLLLSELMDTAFPSEVGICLLEMDHLLFLGNLFAPEKLDKLPLADPSHGFLAWKPRDRRSVFCLRDCGNEQCIPHLQKAVEEFLGQQCWYEAFRSILEGYSFFSAPQHQHSRSCFLLSEFEKTFKPHMKKIVTLFLAHIKELPQ